MSQQTKMKKEVGLASIFYRQLPSGSVKPWKPPQEQLLPWFLSLIYLIRSHFSSVLSKANVHSLQWYRNFTRLLGEGDGKLGFSPAVWGRRSLDVWVNWHFHPPSTSRTLFLWYSLHVTNSSNKGGFSLGFWRPLLQRHWGQKVMGPRYWEIWVPFFLHLSVTWPWAKCFTSLSISLPTYKMGTNNLTLSRLTSL